MVQLTQQERDDRNRVRQDIWREAMRLSKLPEVKQFVANRCTKIYEDNRVYYEINDRKTTNINTLKTIIRDNIRPALVNDNTPFAWPDFETKVSALVDGILLASIPLEEKQAQRNNPSSRRNVSR